MELPELPPSDYTVPQYCSRCGSGLQARDVHGETSWVCDDCGQRHFRRPTAGVAVVVVEGGRVLLVERAFGMKAGQWCIPCGHVGWDEDLRDAAVREAREETGLQVELDEVLAAHSNFWRPERQTVGIWFAGRRVGGNLQAGDDASDARFFALDDLPELAFTTDELVLAQLRDGAVGADARGDGPLVHASRRSSATRDRRDADSDGTGSEQEPVGEDENGALRPR